MERNVVTVSGMFGDGHTYFADSPVVIDISGLKWPGTSPFNVVKMEVLYQNNVVGHFQGDTYGQSSISFDVSSALRAIWADYGFGGEVEKAGNALSAQVGQPFSREMRRYFLRIYTEYVSDDDGGVFTITQCEDEHGNTDIPGGQCLLGGLTEWERSLITDDSKRDVSALEHTGIRNGDASTKPTSSPEKVGWESITSWVDVQSGYTKSIFYPAAYNGRRGENDDVAGREQGWTGHAPIVLRDTVPYVDFLFVNRRGAVETCSAQPLESMSIDVESTQYARVERPTFRPSRSIMSFATGGRRSWEMSSGYVTREWAEWWVLEFLMAKQRWMLYKGRFVPVTVTPAKKSTTIYDRTKQQMSSVEFTVTLALEG